MQNDSSFAQFKEIIQKKQTTKAPAYPWQDLALRIIAELNVPSSKRNSVFKVCKTKPAHIILKAFNDTKELCKSGEKWKYFFKIVNS
jgi:hypothetical protein